MMFSLLLAAALQISLPETSMTGSIDKPLQLTIDLNYPKEFKPVPGSVTQSLIQQESPFPPPYIILEEHSTDPGGKDVITQRISYLVQPIKTGSTTLLLQAQFQNADGDHVTTFAPPLTLTIEPVKIDQPLLPPPFDPARDLTPPEYSSRLGLLDHQKSLRHVEEFSASIDKREIPWWEIAAGVFIAILAALFTYRNIIEKQKTIPHIVTRYGLIRNLKRLAGQQDITDEAFFSALEKDLRSYLAIPGSFTVSEALNRIAEGKQVNSQQIELLQELLNFCEEAKFAPNQNTPEKQQAAIKLTESITHGDGYK